MSSTGAGYDDSCAVYSPDGRVYQVEYAEKAISQSGTCIGVKCSDGIVLAVEKLLPSKMLVATSNRKIYNVTDYIGIATCGWTADARHLVHRAQEEARSYQSNYGHHIAPTTLSTRMGGYLHAYTCYYQFRPFGASIIMAGFDTLKKEAHLTMTEHDGNSYRYFGCALGKGARSAKTEIEKQKFGLKTCAEAIPLLAKILMVTHEEVQEKPYKLEMSWLCKETEFKHKRLSEEAIAAAQEWAKKSIEDDDSDDSSDMSDDEDDDKE